MTDAEARALHRSSIVIDAHCDTIFVPFGERHDFAVRSGKGDVDVPRLLDGGVTCQFMAMLVNDEHRGASRALAGLDILHSAMERCPDLLLATRAADIRAAKAAGKVAALLALESSDALEGEVAALRPFHRLGVRSLGLTHNRRNRAADGILDIGTGGGLSSFGREVVREMNRLGMLLDISHLTPAGVTDVLAIAEAPIIASHSNAHALRPDPRNLTDGQLEAVARNGGVVCVTYVDKFLTDERPTLEHVLDHIDHIVSVAGIDHAGLGSDYDGFVGPKPVGLEDISCMPNVTTGLARRGYAPDAIGRIIGGNLLRVIERACG